MIKNATQFKALQATARKRGTEKYIKDTTEILYEVAKDETMQKLWKRYQNKFSYAAELPWTIVMNSVRKLINRF